MLEAGVGGEVGAACAKIESERLVNTVAEKENTDEEGRESREGIMRDRDSLVDVTLEELLDKPG
jgi:hypothetical protein